METTDWYGSRNALRAAMEQSVENALGIATYTRNALYAHRNDADPGFNVIFAETDEKYIVLLDALGIKESTGSTQKANTTNVEYQYSLMSANLNHYEDKVRPIFGKGTTEYIAVFGTTRDRFYHGSYEQRENCVLGLAKAMSAYPALAAIQAEVLAYYNVLKDARQAQQGLISGFKTYSAEVFTAIEQLILQLDRDLGWLKFFYAMQEDAQGKINAYFDIERIMYHSNDKTYPKLVPVGGFAKVCRRAFKNSDKVRITVDGTEDANFCLLPVGMAPEEPANVYRGVAGTTVEKMVVEIFPSLTEKQVVVFNTSTSLSTHIIFEIIEA